MLNKKKLLTIVAAVIAVIVTGGNLFDFPDTIIKVFSLLGLAVTLVERFGAK
jgi:hypothetical protein